MTVGIVKFFPEFFSPWSETVDINVFPHILFSWNFAICWPTVCTSWQWKIAV